MTCYYKHGVYLLGRVEIQSQGGKIHAWCQGYKAKVRLRRLYKCQQPYYTKLVCDHTLRDVRYTTYKYTHT